MELADIYTPLEEARAEVWRRWEDIDLRRRVEEFLGGVPPGSNGAPQAFLCRSVQTPNREFARFMERSRLIGLAAYAGEYLDDRFCSMNADKRCLVRMTVLRGANRRGAEIFQRHVIVAGAKFDGQPFPSLRTRWRETLVDIHHRLLREFFPEVQPANESAWIGSCGRTLQEFYTAYLTRFLCHGVLLENYLETPHEASFTHEVALPAFEQVSAIFGLKPLIVPLLPAETAADPSRTWYGKEVEKSVVEGLSSAGLLATRR